MNQRNMFLMLALLICLLVLIWMRLAYKEVGAGSRPVTEVVKVDSADVVVIEENTVVTAASEPKKEIPEELTSAGIIPLDQLERIRSETKGSLSAAYSAQKSYYAEYSRYTTDLKAAGWQPPEPVLKFKAGFIKSFTPDRHHDTESVREEPGRMDTDSFINEPFEGTSESYSYADAVSPLRLGDFSNLCQRGCTAGVEGFEMMVVVPLGPEGHYDVWTINDKKELSLVHDGAQPLP